MSATNEQKPNMRSVAAMAGVSHQTVSRVLNGHPNIRPETRDRVLAVINEVKYRPNSAARALATSKSNRLGVIIESAVEYGPNSTLRAIEDAARATGYTVSSVALAGTSTLNPHAAVEHLMAQGVDAICVIAPRSSSIGILRELDTDIPTLVIKSEPDDTFLTTSVDQERGASLAVDHLISLGHRDIVHVAGPHDWLDARAREIGWRASMEHAGLATRPPVVGDWSSDFGYEYARSLEGIPPFTAIFASNDQMALGLVHGFRERGVRVPDDVSVVGFDDLPDSRHFVPPLTTVRQDFQALGQRSVETLLAELMGREIPRRSLIVPELIVRESSAPPRSGR